MIFCFAFRCSVQCAVHIPTLFLYNSGLSSWDDIERLNFFPKLVEVKVKGIPLLHPYTDDERRSLVLAQ